MAEQTPTTIGKRLQSARKRRGLTQRELADLSGVSLSLIRQLEQEQRDDTRLETVRKLAVALRLPTSVLVAGSDADKARPESVERWAPVRDALVGKYGAQPEEAPTVEGVTSALAALIPLFRADRYSDILPVLPSLLRDADALESEGRAVRAQLLHLAGWFLTHTHQYDAADMALGRALDAAPDTLTASAVVSNICWLLIRQGKLHDCIQLASKWADDTEPRLSRATADELSAWGWLLIRVSTAAIRDNRPGVAEDSLRLAHAAAVRLGREVHPNGDFLRSFGPGMVTLKKAENLIIADRPDHVITLSERVPRAGMRPNSNNWNRHLLDVADARTRLGERGEALGVLMEVKDNAPEWLVEQRYARDVMAKIVEKRRTLTPEMRDMADFLRLPY